jgi:hypothetical protein
VARRGQVTPGQMKKGQTPGQANAAAYWLRVAEVVDVEAASDEPRPTALPPWMPADFGCFVTAYAAAPYVSRNVWCCMSAGQWTGEASLEPSARACLRDGRRGADAPVALELTFLAPRGDWIPVPVPVLDSGPLTRKGAEQRVRIGRPGATASVLVRPKGGGGGGGGGGAFYLPSVWREEAGWSWSDLVESLKRKAGMRRDELADAFLVPSWEFGPFRTRARTRARAWNVPVRKGGLASPDRGTASASASASEPERELEARLLVSAQWIARQPALPHRWTPRGIVPADASELVRAWATWAETRAALGPAWAKSDAVADALWADTVRSNAMHDWIAARLALGEKNTRSEEARQWLLRAGPARWAALFREDWTFGGLQLLLALPREVFDVWIDATSEDTVRAALRAHGGFAVNWLAQAMAALPDDLWTRARLVLPMRDWAEALRAALRSPTFLERVCAWEGWSRWTRAEGLPVMSPNDVRERVRDALRERTPGVPVWAYHGRGLGLGKGQGRGMGLGRDKGDDLFRLDVTAHLLSAWRGAKALRKGW